MRRKESQIRYFIKAEQQHRTTMRFTGIFLVLCYYVSDWGFWGAVHAHLPHVLHYDVVRLQTIKGIIKRSDSPHQKYPDTAEYGLAISGRNLTIYLEKNRELLGKNYTLTYYTEDGNKETTTAANMDHCYYQGHIRNVKDSSVSVGLCSGMRGFVRIENKVYLIQPLTKSLKGDHAIYKQEHLRTKRTAVRYINDTVYDLGPRVAGLHKSRHMVSLRVQRYVELVLVVDNKEFKKFGSLKNVEKRMLEVANHVDKLYRPLNIRVMLVGLEVWSNKDQIEVSHQPNLTLEFFLKWRQTYLLPRKKHDNAQFVTGVNFEGSTVGLAPMNSMCSPSSGAVNEDHTSNPVGVASTIAHEMGHNLGMSHDDPSLYCVCPKSSDTNCVMEESIGPAYPESFSSCSKAALETFLQNYDTRCLLDVPKEDEMYGGPVCGNGFVEKGEECDCGTLQECNNPCCNSTTCQLTEDSQCAHGECCHNCKVKQAGSLCRASAHDCDLEEYCTGMSEQCPKDDYKMNGLPCNYNQGYCYNGQCPTHKDHCSWLWGPGASVDIDMCFNSNDRSCKRPGFHKCFPQDMKCGKIFCTSTEAFPITKKVGTITYGSKVCKFAVDNSGKQDIGLVPTGTKCGTNKVCYKSLCQDISIYGNKNCSAKCNNRGVCNHEKQCHCDPGWAPPYCDIKLSDLPNRRNALIIGVTTTILLLIILVVGVTVCYRKQKSSTEKRFLRDINAYPGQCNPGFQPSSAKNSPRCGPPRISRPTFLESSTTQACRPLHSPVIMASRPAPQPPNGAEQSWKEKTTTVIPTSKPMPPSRPLPPLINKQIHKPAPPPVPPVKPSCINPEWNSPKGSVAPRVPLKPFPKYR